MPKKVHKLGTGSDLAVLGLNATLPPYVLAARLNRTLEWNLVRSPMDAELALGQSQELSAFQLFYQNLEFYNTPLCLVANQGSLGLLLPPFRAFNFLVTWPLEALEYQALVLQRRMLEVEGVRIAADLTMRLGPALMENLRFDPPM